MAKQKPSAAAHNAPGAPPRQPIRERHGKAGPTALPPQGDAPPRRRGPAHSHAQFRDASNQGTAAGIALSHRSPASLVLPGQEESPGDFAKMQTVSSQTGHALAATTLASLLMRSPGCSAPLLSPSEMLSHRQGLPQALFVSSNSYNENQWDCQKTRDTVLTEISRGAFHVPTAAAQILPALMGKTYLDVNKDSFCVYGSDPLHISTLEPVSVTPTVSPSQIQVNYSVVINNGKDHIVVSVPNGSVFLNVMEQAQKENATLFSFTAEESPWGPYITSVQGIKANNNDRTYWKLLSNGEPLSQGVGSYVVHQGDHLEVRWSTY
ncbi:transcobalamin-1-like [Ailuropoda melanoleuca]|uniref:transcobalamin-1-like n=1 Tax=Ailuropoda melanoleuca TaxID=9646 RepID=UPI001494E375|nr:transcobalamin-1-like [Ailuropoda melanoleuca]